MLGLGARQRGIVELSQRIEMCVPRQCSPSLLTYLLTDTAHGGVLEGPEGNKQQTDCLSVTVNKSALKCGDVITTGLNHKRATPVLYTIY